MSIWNMALRIQPSGKILVTGSSVICTPEVTDTDIDLVTVYDDATHQRLLDNGFVVSEHVEYPNSHIVHTYRKAQWNVIAVETQKAYDDWEKATVLARYMNLREKHQRVTLFQFITEGQVRGTEIKY